MLSESEKMIRNLAHKFHMDFEDCLQEAACDMLENWDKIPATCTNVKAYLNRCIYNRITELRKKRLDTFSLEAPIDCHRQDSYADILEAPEQTLDTTQVDYIIDTVHSALRECMLEEQEYTVKAFEMHAFSPVAPARRRPGLKAFRDINQRGEIGNIRKSMMTVMRKNPQVQGLLQPETCVL
jgi:hypothetical protein